jgi:hypothetical protein
MCEKSPSPAASGEGRERRVNGMKSAPLVTPKAKQEGTKEDKRKSEIPWMEAAHRLAKGVVGRTLPLQFRSLTVKL